MLAQYGFVILLVVIMLGGTILGRAIIGVTRILLGV